MPDSQPASVRKFLTRADSAPGQEDLWRSISLFNIYRLVLACLAIFLTKTFGDALSLGSGNLTLFFRAGIAYAVLALVSQVTIKLRWPRLSVQLAFQMGMDIICLTVLLHTSGGIGSGLGMLMLVSLAAAGLISRGRITLFFAALASIAVLLEQAYMVVVHDADGAGFLQAGLLSAAYFVVAWVAHSLAKYAIASEQLAALRGVDLANMAEANRLVIQDLPDGILVVDEHGVVRQHNPSAGRLLGYVFPDNGSVTLEQCAPLLAHQFEAWRQNLVSRPEVVRLPTTHQRTCVRFLPVQREGFWGAVVFLEDMERVQAQAQQIKLAAMGRLTASIAHEVRNPLASISYATELLQEGSRDAAQQRLLSIILDNTARLNRIVQDVMRLNQRDRAQGEPLPLCEVLPSFVAGLSQAERVAQEVFLIDAPPACVVNFDRGHFDQVLWNLCCNALRYCSKTAGSVRLLVRQAAEDRMMLEVADDGPGVAPDAAAQLFEPFYTTAVDGTGLGLYIARELCEANGAELEYVPQTERGAKFRVTFGRGNER